MTAYIYDVTSNQWTHLWVCMGKYWSQFVWFCPHCHQSRLGFWTPPSEGCIPLQYEWR